MKPSLSRTVVVALGWVGLVACLGGCQQPQAQPDRESKPDAADFDSATDLAPSPKTLYAAARILASGGRDAEYEAALLRIIKEQPRCVPAYCDLARLRLRHENLTGAIDALQSGLTVAPDDSVLLNDLGMCWLARNDHAKALQAFTRATSLAPHNHKYRANMAVALGMLGRYEESLALYEQVVSREVAAQNLAILREAHRKANPAKPSPASEQKQESETSPVARSYQEQPPTLQVGFDSN